MVKLIAGAALAVAAFAMAVTPTSAGPVPVVEPVRPVRPVRPVLPARPVQPADDDGLRAEARTSFVVDPGARVIRASTEMSLTHRYDPDYYFHAYDIPVMKEAVNHRVVRSDGGALDVQVEADQDPEQGVAHAIVDLQPNLYAGDTITFRLDYEVPFQAPRSAGWSRGNDAVITFPAFTPGDAGLARLEVRVPAGYDIEMGGDELERSEADGQVVLQADAIPEPWLFTTAIVATRDDEMLTSDTEIDGRTVTLRAWPDDAAWIDYVGGQLTAQMPVLEDLVGQPWPALRSDELEVIESSAPGAHGYAGWFDLAEGSITLGDAFDPATIAHELAHAWSNDQLFAGRWIYEGLADEYAESTLEQLATPGFVPAGRPVPDPAGPAAQPLNDWAESWSLDEVDHERETYAYQASWHVLDQIADEVGVDGMRSVVALAGEGRIAYAGDGEREEVAGTATWQTLLDLLENDAGSTRADGLFATFVVNGEQRAELDARRAARVAYAGLAERGAGWTPPFELREAMGAWEFEAVTGLVASADEVLAVRAEIEEVLAGLDVEAAGLEATYETEDELADVADEAEATLDAARAYRDAREQHDDVAGGALARLGLLGSDVDGRLDAARSDLEDGGPGRSLDASDDVAERLDVAVRNGLLRLAAVVILVLLLGFTLVWRPLHRRRHDRVRHREVDQLEAMYAAPEAPEPVPSAPSPPVEPVPPTDGAPPSDPAPH